MPERRFWGWVTIASARCSLRTSFSSRLLVKDELESRGFIVLEAGDGLNAIAMFDDLYEVDLLVTNVSMPGADRMTSRRPPESGTPTFRSSLLAPHTNPNVGADPTPASRHVETRRYGQPGPAGAHLVKSRVITPGFSPAGASLGGGAFGSSTRSNSSAPLLRTLLTARTQAKGAGRLYFSCSTERGCDGEAVAPVAVKTRSIDWTVAGVSRVDITIP